MFKTTQINTENLFDFVGDRDKTRVSDLAEIYFMMSRRKRKRISKDFNIPENLNFLEWLSAFDVDDEEEQKVSRITREQLFRGFVKSEIKKNLLIKKYVKWIATLLLLVYPVLPIPKWLVLILDKVKMLTSTLIGN